MRQYFSILTVLLALPFACSACKSSDFSGQAPTKKQNSDNATGKDDEGTADGTTSGEQLDGNDDDNDDGNLGEEGESEGNADSDIIDGDNDSTNEFESGDTVKDYFNADANRNKIDVMMFFDQSGSMQKFISEVSQRLSTFIQNFKQSKKTLDYRMLVVAKDFNLTIQDDRIGHAKIAIGNHNAVDVFKDLITGKVSTGSIKLRKSSTKEFIVVSNDNSSQTAEAFGEWAKTNRSKVGRIHINSFIGFKSTGPLGYLGPCYIDKAGTNYINMAKHKYLEGLAQDMCTGNWDTLMNNLGKKITTIDSKVFDLSEEPVTSSIEVKVGGDVLSSGSWSYDESSNAVTITSSLKADDKIIITYTKK